MPAGKLSRRDGANPQAFSSNDRDRFHGHLFRLDREARRDRFGCCFLDDDFLERYVQNIDFGNTALWGLLIAEDVRALAELRSLTPEWASQAELILTVETAWRERRFGNALFKQAAFWAQEHGIRELYTHCDLATRCSLGLLRFLSSEGQSEPAGPLAVFELQALGNEPVSILPSEGAILVRLAKPG
ncbi:MAG: hypothetical protein WBX25_16365 [Rhodomicrobium sp.]